MNYSRMSFNQLSDLAKELGAWPEEGSGKKGKVTKKDLIAALEPGDAPTANTPEEQWEPSSQQKYQFDRMYRVQEPFSGYEKGDEVCNLPRSVGLALVESGAIKLIESSPRKSNPHAIMRVKPA